MHVLTGIIAFVLAMGLLGISYANAFTTNTADQVEESQTQVKIQLDSEVGPETLTELEQDLEKYSQVRDIVLSKENQLLNMVLDADLNTANANAHAMNHLRGVRALNINSSVNTEAGLRSYGESGFWNSMDRLEAYRKGQL